MKIVTVLLLMLATHLYAAHQGPKPAVSVYRNNYKGLTTGVTTKEQMIEILGEPRSTKTVSGGLHALYPQFTVTFGANRPGINTIIILEDAHYRCPNGFKLGDEASVLKTLPQATTRFSPGFTADFKNGVVYWTDIEKGHNVASIQRIVLAGAMVDRTKPAKPSSAAHR